MLGIVIAVLIAVSVLYGIFSGNLADVSTAALGGCQKAVELCLFLGGAMALWCGIMNIADKCGITDFICRIISPFTRLLIKCCDKKSGVIKNVNMNIVAHLLGLGNAAAAPGIAAVREMGKHNSPYTRRNIAVFTVLNTASIQLIPASVGAIRLAHGSSKPFAIIPAVLVTSLISAAVGVITAVLLYSHSNKIQR